jgi:hypothetical protein
MMPLSIALVHHPVVDREGQSITTAITNLDLHDIARSACTYGVSDVFIVHPVAAQRELAERVQSHWVGGSGARRIPTREAAMRLLRIVSSLHDVYAKLGGRGRIEVWATSARAGGRSSASFARARERLGREGSSGHAVLLLGTGWGLAASVIDSADVLLAPLAGASPTGYNHLSVRAACAIALDRLLGGARGE